MCGGIPHESLAVMGIFPKNIKIANAPLTVKDVFIIKADKIFFGRVPNAIWEARCGLKSNPGTLLLLTESIAQKTEDHRHRNQHD